MVSPPRSRVKNQKTRAGVCRYGVRSVGYASASSCFRISVGLASFHQYAVLADDAWSGQHTLRLYKALSPDEASVLVQARMKHRGPDAFLFRKTLADNLVCKCGRGDETVLHMVLRCDKYDEVCKMIQEAGRIIH